MGEKYAKKLPFQWMLDNDNAALEKRYYRLDDLIKFLDRSKSRNRINDNIIYDLDQQRSIQSHSNIRTKEFDSVFPINSRLLLLKLAPYQIVNNTVA
jgi:hypothetical protein